MNLKFEGEAVNVGGMELIGTVLIEARATDGSFCHAFGTEKVEDVEFSPDGFVPDVDITLKWGLVERGVAEWLDAHEKQVAAAYEKAASRSSSE